MNLENTVSYLVSEVAFHHQKLEKQFEPKDNFFGQCELNNVDRLMLILDVPSRWNSTLYMIQRVIEVRGGLKNWLSTEPEFGEMTL